MKDEIASFKVTAADIQKQSVHPSGDRHTQRDVAILYFYTFCASSGMTIYLQYSLYRNISSLYLLPDSMCEVYVFTHVDGGTYLLTWDNTDNSADLKKNDALKII